MSEMPYILKLKNMTGYMEPCFYCGDKKCDGCPLPYAENITYNDLQKNLEVTQNVSFYMDDYNKRGRKDIIIEIILTKQMHKGIYETL